MPFVKFVFIIDDIVALETKDSWYGMFTKDHIRGRITSQPPCSHLNPRVLEGCLKIWLRQGFGRDTLPVIKSPNSAVLLLMLSTGSNTSQLN